MTLALSMIGIAYAALCVWLLVRIINRRERWAKGTLAGVVAMPLLYVASFGPACWMTSRVDPYGGPLYPSWMTIYAPLGKLLVESSGPLEWWVQLGIPNGHLVLVPVGGGDAIPVGP
jgi:hypothetical protein